MGKGKVWSFQIHTNVSYQERKTEPENLYFAPLPEKYRHHDKKSIQDVVISYMKRYDIDIFIENAKIGEGKNRVR